jgi:hypothetical protein
MAVYIPVMTNDIIVNRGKRFVVKSVTMTEGGPILSVNPVDDETIIMHISEVDLSDPTEKERRAKSIGATGRFKGLMIYNPNTTSRRPSGKSLRTIPEGIDDDEAKRVLEEYARAKRQSARKAGR